MTDNIRRIQDLERLIETAIGKNRNEWYLELAEQLLQEEKEKQLLSNKTKDNMADKWTKFKDELPLHRDCFLTDGQRVWVQHVDRPADWREYSRDSMEDLWWLPVIRPSVPFSLENFHV